MKTPAAPTRARKPSSPLDLGIPDADTVIGFKAPIDNGDGT